MKASGQALNEKNWQFIVAGLTLVGRIIDDAESAGINWIQVQRTGTTAISSVVFPTPNFTVGNGTNQPIISANGGAGQLRALAFNSANTSRWLIYADSAAESTGNAGSNFIVSAYNDNGSFLDSPIVIRRVPNTPIILNRPTYLMDGAPVYSKVMLSIAGNSAGSFGGMEFGHNNPVGYRSHLGHESSSGASFLGFQTEPGTNPNTYRTRGLRGAVIVSTLSTSGIAGGIVFATVANPTADNQTLTYRGALDYNGTWIFGPSDPGGPANTIVRIAGTAFSSGGFFADAGYMSSNGGIGTLAVPMFQLYNSNASPYMGRLVLGTDGTGYKFGFYRKHGNTGAVTLCGSFNDDGGWSIGPNDISGPGGIGSGMFRVAGAGDFAGTVRTGGHFVMIANNAYIQGMTTSGAVVQLFTLSSDTNNITRIMAGVDAGGIQLTNQAQTVQWALFTATAAVFSGSINMPNNTALYALNNTSTQYFRLIQMDANNVVQVGDQTNGKFVSHGQTAVGSLPAAGPTVNGVMAIDGTNNRFVFYVNGSRYYVTGTAF
jgi:hypothetical protein